MKETALALFQLGFKDELIQIQGLVSFLLLLFWIERSRGDLRSRVLERKHWLAWLAACLGFSAVFGIAAYDEWGPEFALVAASIGLSLGLAMASPTVCVCLMTSLLFQRPWELIETNPYFALLPRLTITLCAGHILLLWSRRGKIDFRWDRTSVFIALFGVWSFTSSMKAGDPGAAQGEFFDTFFKSLMLYLFVSQLLPDRRALETFVDCLILTFLAVGIVSVYRTLGTAHAAPVTPEIRLIGIGAFANSNDIAALMDFIFPFCLVRIFRPGIRPSMRIASVATTVIAIASIHLSQSRGALIGLALGIAGYAWIRTRKRWILAAIVLGGIATVPLYLQFSGRATSDLSQSSESRMTYIKTGLVMGAKNPLFGVGFDQYGIRFENYATEILYEWGHRTAHNSWILALAETGLPGLLLFVACFWTALSASWAIAKVAPEYGLSLVSYGIAMTFLSHTYLMYPYLLYALVGVAHRIYRPDLSCKNPALIA